MIKCSHCDEIIDDNLSKCPYCFEKITTNGNGNQKIVKISIYKNQIGKVLTIEGKKQVKGEFKINIPENVKVGDIFEVDGIQFEIENIMVNKKKIKGIIFYSFLIIFFILFNIFNKINNQNNNGDISTNSKDYYTNTNYIEKSFEYLGDNNGNNKQILDFINNKETYYSKDSTKSMGIDIKIDYPKEWEKQEGKRPHVLSLIQSPMNKDKIITSLTILVTENEQNLDINDLIPIYNTNSFEKIEGQNQVDRGILTIENQPFLWEYLESENARRVGKNLKSHRLLFYTIVNGKFLNIQLGSVGEEINADKIKKDFSGNIELFKSILNTIIINNNYENEG